MAAEYGGVERDGEIQVKQDGTISSACMEMVNRMRMVELMLMKVESWIQFQYED